MGWKEFSSVKKTVIALAAVLLATGVVLASGNFLGQTSVNQVIDTLQVTVIPAPGSDWDSVAQGSPFPFSVRVTNPTELAIGDIHLHLTLVCSSGLASAVITGQLFAPDVGKELCFGGPTAQSTAKSLGASPSGGPNVFVTWDFSVTYSPPGDAAWTFEARLGTPA